MSWLTSSIRLMNLLERVFRLDVTSGHPELKLLQFESPSQLSLMLSLKTMRRDREKERNSWLKSKSKNLKRNSPKLRREFLRFRLKPKRSYLKSTTESIWLKKKPTRKLLLWRTRLLLLDKQLLLNRKYIVKISLSNWTSSDWFLRKYWRILWKTLKTHKRQSIKQISKLILPQKNIWWIWLNDGLLN